MTQTDRLKKKVAQLQQPVKQKVHKPKGEAGRDFNLKKACGLENDHFLAIRVHVVSS